MSEPFLFVKGPDVGGKYAKKKISDPLPVQSSEMVGDVLFVKGCDTISRTH